MSALTSETAHGFPVIKLGNRYLSFEDEVGGEDTVSLSEELDPMGILKGIAAQHGLVRVQDNVVEYYNKQATANGVTR